MTTLSQIIMKAVQTKIKLADLQTYADLNKLANSSVSIFPAEIKNDDERKQAYTQYSEKLLQEYYDLNKDGKTTVEEFAQKEQNASEKALKLQKQGLSSGAIKNLEADKDMLKFYDTTGDGKISIDEYNDGLKKLGLSDMVESTELSDQEKRIAHNSANLFAKNLDMDGDGKISTKELTFFNEQADQCDGKADGIITNAGESVMFSAVTGMNANDKEINRVVNKYLLGETLTTEEQATLDRGTSTIRNSMKKAAGWE